MNKKAYLSGIEWSKTHDDIGGVSANIIFSDNMSYAEYGNIRNTFDKYVYVSDNDLQEENNRQKYLLLEQGKELKEIYAENEELKFNWNKLKKMLDYETMGSILYSDKNRYVNIDEVLDKMQELEGEE